MGHRGRVKDRLGIAEEINPAPIPGTHKALFLSADRDLLSGPSFFDTTLDKRRPKRKTLGL